MGKQEQEPSEIEVVDEFGHVISDRLDAPRAIPQPAALQAVPATFVEDASRRQTLVAKLVNYAITRQEAEGMVKVVDGPVGRLDFRSIIDGNIQSIYNMMFSIAKKVDEDELIHHTLFDINGNKVVLREYNASEALDPTANNNLSLRSSTAKIQVDGSEAQKKQIKQQELADRSYCKVFGAYAIAAINWAQMYFPEKKNENENALVADQIKEIHDKIFDEVNAILDGHQNTEEKIENILARGKRDIVQILLNRLKGNASTYGTSPHRDAIVEIINFIKPTGYKTFKTKNIIEETETWINIYLRKALEKMLNQAKDWAAMEEQTYTVATVIRAKEKNSEQEKTIVLLDEPQGMLTSKQHEQFASISPDEADKPSWYTSASPFQQKIYQHYLPNALKFNSIAPSQTRATSPFMRNAWHQSVSAVDNANATVNANDIREVNAWYHTGTPAFLNHNPNDDKQKKQEKDNIAIPVTKENLLQQKLNAKADVSLMISLNSELADLVAGVQETVQFKPTTKKDDSKIVELSLAAVKELQHEGENIYFSKLCLNGFRVIESDLMDGIKNVVAIIKNNLLNMQVNSEEHRQLQAALQLLDQRLEGRLLNRLTGDKNVQAIDIICSLTKVAYLNNKIIGKTANAKGGNLKTVAVWYGCASGENRTGVTEFCNLVDAATEAYNDNCTIDWVEHIARSKHVNFMTGTQGSILGTDGIRSKSKGSLPERLKQYTSDLVTRRSDFKAIEDIEFTTVQANINILGGWTRTSETNDQKPTDMAECPLDAELRMRLDNLKYTLQLRLKTASLLKNDAEAKDELRKIREVLDETEIMYETYLDIKGGMALPRAAGSAGESASDSDNDSDEAQAKKANLERKIEKFIDVTKKYEEKLVKLSVGEKIVVAACAFVGGLLGAAIGAVAGFVAGIFVGGAVGSVVPGAGNIAGAGLFGGLGALAGTLVGAAALSYFWGRSAQQHFFKQDGRSEVKIFGEALRNDVCNTQKNGLQTEKGKDSERKLEVGRSSSNSGSDEEIRRSAARLSVSSRTTT
ncbi:MAG TPA: hypothetical protein VHZ76_10765 [Gammaproteobacteria bacterium]|jgi:hypothetical protein|nr:hypothetical protein [Gammaproteobacteria bacterium]